MAQTNAICSDLGTHESITSFVECQNAVPFIQSQFSGIATKVNPEEQENKPKGCHVRGNTLIGIYFNTHKFGKPTMYGTEVCIAKGK